MIRIILRGRTGNNLFQYALGRTLAAKHGVPLVLDASWFNAEGWAEVSHFLKLPIKAKVIRRFPFASRVIRKLARKHYWELLGIPVLRESDTDHSFDARIANASSNCVLTGYFQSPLYFEGIAGGLRVELNTLLAASAQATDGNPMADSLSNPRSVAVHVRRGDYLNHPAFSVCDTDYYRTSMDRLREMLNSPRFFIFSDDPAWCGNEFTDTDTVVVDSGTASANPLHDLHLMSLASHHVIANSSYSWWAAWLGDKQGQQVIMPKRWFSRDIKAPVDEKLWK